MKVGAQIMLYCKYNLYLKLCLLNSLFIMNSHFLETDESVQHFKAICALFWRFRGMLGIHAFLREGALGWRKINETEVREYK